MGHVNRRLVATAVGALIFAFLFGWSFIAAFHEPTPHQVPVGVVGPAPQAQQLGAMLNSHIPGGLSLHSYATPAAAEDAIKHQAVEGAFVPGPHAVLMIASAAGNATAQFLQATFTTVAASSGMKLQVSDVVPLPAGNSEGLAIFFLMLSVLIPSLAIGAISTLAARQAKAWAQAIVLTVAAIVMGALAVLIADQITGAVHGHYFALAGICALLSLAVSATTAALARIAPPGAALAVLAIVVVGIPATGGPVGMARFMPAFFRDLAPGLPASRALPALTNTAYFSGHETVTDLWVLALWAVAGLLILPLGSMLHRSATEDDAQPREVVGSRPVPSS